MVLLTLIMNNVPKTSKQRPIFVMYLAFMLGLALFSVLCLVITNILPTKLSKKVKKYENDTDESKDKEGETTYDFDDGSVRIKKENF